MYGNPMDYLIASGDTITALLCTSKWGIFNTTHHTDYNVF